MLEFIGHVSTEGGPLLIADRTTLSGWTGVEGGDYERLCDALVASEPRALAVGLAGSAALAWNVPTGTAEAWRTSPSSVLLTRPWVDQEEDARRLAQPPMNGGEPLGRVSIPSGWLVVLWAPEPGSDVLAVEPRDGLSLELSVGCAALVIEMPPGEYECHGDEVDIGTASAWRCHLTPVASG